MSETRFYTNELHEALLLSKRDPEFWKCWRSKFGSSNKCQQVDGCVDDELIASKFVHHFALAYSCNNENRAAHIRQVYEGQRAASQ